MTYAAIEIMVLLLLAGLVGAVVGFAIGSVRTAAMSKLMHRRRSKAELQHRLVEAQQAISMLERTIDAAGDDEDDFVKGTRLAERVRIAREEEIVDETIETSETQPVA